MLKIKTVKRFKSEIESFINKNKIDIKEMKHINEDNKNWYFITVLVLDKTDKRKSEKIDIYPSFHTDKARAGKFYPHFKNGWSASDVHQYLKKLGFINSID